MPSKHYGWHRRWALDLAAGTATHDTGLVARYSTRDGAVVATLDDQAGVMPALAAKHGGHNMPPMLARLQREALRMREHAVARGARRE